jgi:hypothetical protein
VLGSIEGALGAIFSMSSLLTIRTFELATYNFLSFSLELGLLEFPPTSPHVLSTYYYCLALQPNNGHLL